ncbi:MAG: hypothetical protein JWQ97_438 [Phenylobacterium sp.]|nr:hypothetical protein [Phenylobacterium sp.]
MADLDPDSANILASKLSISDKIRRLASLGHSRSRIADLVGRSYQQVRQVLVEDERRARRGTSVGPAEPLAPASGVAESQQVFGEVVRLRLESDGVLRLPPEALRVLNVGASGVLIGEVREEGLMIFTPAAALEKARTLFRRLNIDPSRDLVEELIAERRAEAARESRDD